MLLYATAATVTTNDKTTHLRSEEIRISLAPIVLFLNVFDSPVHQINDKHSSFSFLQDHVKYTHTSETLRHSRKKEREEEINKNQEMGYSKNE